MSLDSRLSDKLHVLFPGETPFFLISNFQIFFGANALDHPPVLR